MHRLLKAIYLSILLVAVVGMGSIIFDLFMLLTLQARQVIGVLSAVACLVAFNYFLIWLFEVYLTVVLAIFGILVLLGIIGL